MNNHSSSMRLVRYQHIFEQFVGVEALFQQLSTQHSQSEGGPRSRRNTKSEGGPTLRRSTTCESPSILFEINEPNSPYYGMSIGIYQPSICIRGRGSEFSITALDARGEQLLPALLSQLPSTASIHTQNSQSIQGTLVPDLSKHSLKERLSASNHMDIIRACELPIIQGADDLPLGLYGCFAYDFVHQFENVPRTSRDVLQDDDYVLYLPTRLFITQRQTQNQHHRTHFISLVPEGRAAKTEATIDINTMQAAAITSQKAAYSAITVGEFKSDTSRHQYDDVLKQIKTHIQEGDAFQVVYGRMVEADFEGDPLTVYKQLKQISPSPFHFYMQDESGVILGASPELALRVNQDDAASYVEIHPIAGTKPRGQTGNPLVDNLTDTRHTIALQTDSKELAEHVMLIDLARNDIASIAEPGSTHIYQTFGVERYSHVQHLVSKIRGTLREGLDALTAYLATMNMGTLTGAPKPNALNIIAEQESHARGYFGGAFGFVSSKRLETAIVIRSMRFKNNKVYCRAGGGIVADSVPSKEWEETENKMRACITALQESQHVK